MPDPRKLPEECELFFVSFALRDGNPYRRERWLFKYELHLNQVQYGDIFFSRFGGNAVDAGVYLPRDRKQHYAGSFVHTGGRLWELYKKWYLASEHDRSSKHTKQPVSANGPGDGELLRRGISAAWIQAR